MISDGGHSGRGRRTVLSLAWSAADPLAVRIRPDGLRNRVWFEPAGSGRAACVSVPREVARDFLDRSERAVPCGDERSDEVIDALLARLLSS